MEADRPVIIGGHCAPGWEPVHDAFAANFRNHGEMGASLCIYADDRKVIDLSGGMIVDGGAEDWTADTLAVVFSNTKGATALCAHLLIDRGLLDLDAPVAEYWPEFARNGKERATVAMMLSHAAGVPGFRDPVKPGGVTDWDYMIRRLEEEEPFWGPGTRHGYHAVTFGFTVGELVRRISGRSLGTFFREEIAGPLGIEFWVGLPAELEPRVAPYVPPTPGPIPNGFQIALGQPGSLASLAVLNTGGYTLIDAHGGRGMDTREAHAAEIGGAGGIANARGLAGLYRPLAAGGGALFSADAVHRMSQTYCAGLIDPVLQMRTHFASGFMKTTDNRRSGDANDGMVIGTNAFGHPGAGGSLGFADPDCGLAFGYMMNVLGSGVLLNTRGQSLVDAAYRCLGYRTNAPGAWVR